MAITDTIQITIADVDINDEYRVELRTHRKRTDYTADEADKLAGDLMAAAEKLRALIAADLPKLAALPLPIGSDVTPLPRLIATPDCRDGKHQACTGRGFDLDADLWGPCPCTCHQNGTAA